MSTVKNVVLKAMIDNDIQELMIKTDANNVYVDDNATLAEKLASIITDIATKASTIELTEGLVTKANTSHTHTKSEIIDFDTQDIVNQVIAQLPAAEGVEF